MDGQQYLDQITESNRPMQKAGSKRLGGRKWWKSKVFILGASAVGVIILLAILGAVISGNRVSEKSLSFDLKLHLDYTTEVIDEYQTDVKSANLRSYSASLRGVLSNTSSSLKSYLEDRYGFKDKDISKAAKEAAELEKDALTNELFEAKINGILDRIYAHKMAYEISMLLAEESRIYDNTSNAALQSLLNESYESLTNLYDKFNDFSETKN